MNTLDGPQLELEDGKALASPVHTLYCRCSCPMEVNGTIGTGRVACRKMDLAGIGDPILGYMTSDKAAMIRHPRTHQTIAQRVNAWGRCVGYGRGFWLDWMKVAEEVA
jgi:hypothetical protein